MPPTQVVDPRAGLGVEPRQLAVDLQRELARRRDDQRARRAGLLEPLGFAEQARRERETERDGLARAGLRGDEEVAIGLGLEDGGLDRGGLGVAARGEGAAEGGMGSGERQGRATLVGLGR